MVNENEKGQAQRVCGRCRYDMASLAPAGGAACCPECGWIGVPVAPPERISWVRGILTALVVGASGLGVFMGVGSALLAYRIDWGIDEARRMCATGVLTAIAAGVTGVCAILALRGRARIVRLVLAVLHFGVAVTCAAMLIADTLRQIIPGTYLLALAYSTLAIGGLLTDADWRRMGAVGRRVRVAALVGFVVAGIGAASWSLWFGARATSEADAARVFADRGAGVQWEGPHVVSIMAKARGVSDADLTYLGSLPHLRSLYLSDNPITDAGLIHVARLGQLEYLYIDNTAVTDRGMGLLGGSKTLRSLWASDIAITDASMPAVGTLTNLMDLYLGKTGVGDAGLESLTNLRSLQYLNVPRTKVTSHGARRLEGAIPGLRVWEGEGR